MRVLAGDVGGTKVLLAVIEVADGTARILEERRYESAEHGSLESCVAAFRGEVALGFEAAGFGLAGPVKNGECRTTNLPWAVTARSIAAASGLPRAALINDFTAVGFGLSLLGPAQLATLQAGQPEPLGPVGLIGAGTGLGEGLIFRGPGGAFTVHPSEGGHGDFAPQNEEQAALLKFLRGHFGHVSWERVASGMGLPWIHRFFVEAGGGALPAAIAAEMERDDPAAVITRHAQAGSDPTCMRTLDVFLSAYGAEAGNLALRILATGGVYLAGGIAPRLLNVLTDPEGAFLRAFRDKGRFAGLAATFPVHVITEPRVGLLGAAAAAALGA